MQLRETVKIQKKGVFTIPKPFREELGLEENTLARVTNDKGRLIIEPVRTIPYPVRGYRESDIDEFIKLDEKQSKELKAKNLL